MPASAKLGPHIISPEAGTAYSFTTVDDPADANFNQLLGINDWGIISGYYGDGTVKPNKGYLAIPMGFFAPENFPASAQTQVVGINSLTFPTTVGFWVDAKGNNFGFINKGSVYTSINYPNTPVSGGVTFNQLLGIDNVNLAVGFYLDASGNSHGYIYNAANNKYVAVKLPFAHVVSFLIGGINNTGAFCGSWSDGAKTHGFYGSLSHLVSVDVPGTTATSFTGLNDRGYLAGAVTINGVSNGVVYNTETNAAQIVNDPNQSTSATPAFGFTGTTINTINDNNIVVGFYSDGTKIHGFTASP